MNVKRVASMTAVAVLSTLVIAGGSTTASAAAAAPISPGVQSQQFNQTNREDFGSRIVVQNNVDRERLYVNGELKKGNFVMSGAQQTGADTKFAVGLTPDRSIDIQADNPLLVPASIKIDGHTFFSDGEINIAGMNIKVEYQQEQMDDGKWFKCWGVKVGPQAYDHEYVHNTSEDDGVKGIIKNRTSAPVVLKLGAWEGQRVRLEPGQQLLFFDSHEFSHYQGMKFEAFPVGSDRWTASAYLGDFFDNRKPVSEVYQHGKACDLKHYAENESKTFRDDATGIEMTVKRARDGKLPTPHDGYHTSDWALFAIYINAS